MLLSVAETALIRGVGKPLADRLEAIATVHFGNGSFEPAHASLTAIKVMEGEEKGAIDLIERQKELAGQRTAIALVDTGTLRRGLSLNGPGNVREVFANGRFIGVRYGIAGGSHPKGKLTIGRLAAERAQGAGEDLVHGADGVDGVYVSGSTDAERAAGQRDAERVLLEPARLVAHALAARVLVAVVAQHAVVHFGQDLPQRHAPVGQLEAVAYSWGRRMYQICIVNFARSFE